MIDKAISQTVYTRLDLDYSAPVSYLLIVPASFGVLSAGNEDREGQAPYEIRVYSEAASFACRAAALSSLSNTVQFKRFAFCTLP